MPAHLVPLEAVHNRRSPTEWTNCFHMQAFISAALWSHFQSLCGCFTCSSELLFTEQKSHPNMARSPWFLLCYFFVFWFGAEGEHSRERVYYIGIIEDDWNYAPSGKNLLNGKVIEDDE